MRYIEVGFKCKRSREIKMALPSRLKKILSELFVHADQAKWGQQDWGRYKTQNIERNLEKVIKGLLSYVKLPKSNSDEDLVRWGNSQKNNPIAIDFFSQSKNMDLIVEYLEKQTNIVLSPVALNKANLPQKVIQDIRSRFSLARGEIYKSVTSYFTNAEKYSDIPEGTETGRRVKVPAGDSEVNKILKMTGQQFKLYLSQKIGGCSLEDIQKIKQRHISQKQKVSQSQKDEDLLELGSAVKRFNNLPEILTSLLSLQSNKAMRIRLQKLTGKKPKETLNVNETEILKELIKNRAVAKNAKNLLGKLSPTESVYNAEHLRKAEDILEAMRPALKKGDASAILDIAKNKISPKEKKSLIRSLKKLNIYAGFALESAINVGAITNMKKVQEGFKELENKEKLADFVNDEALLKKALDEPALMTQYKKIGFNPQKFYASNRGRRILRLWKIKIIGLLNDSESSLLKQFYQNDKAQRETKFDSSKDRAKLRKEIAARMVTHLDRIRKDLTDDIKTRYGKSLEKELGSEVFKTLIANTISDYYTSAYKSYIQGYMYHKETNQKSFDIMSSNLQNISTFSKTAIRLKIKTVGDLQNAIESELASNKRRGRVDRSRGSVIEWAFQIQDFTGVMRDRNLLIYEEVVGILNSNEKELAIWSSRVDEQVRDLSDQEDHKQKTDKQTLIDSRTGHRKPDPDLAIRKKNEEKRMLSSIMAQMKSGSPRIRSILNIMEPGQRKKTLIENPLLREVFRYINNLNRNSGLLEGKKAIEIFENPAKKDLDVILGRDKHKKKLDAKDSKEFEKKYKKANPLEEENAAVRKLFMKEFKDEGWRRIRKTEEYKKAKRMATKTMYSERYNELQGLFTRQDDKFDLTRNSALNQHIAMETEKGIRFQEGSVMANEQTMAGHIAQGLLYHKISAGWKTEGANMEYIERMSLGGASLPTMVEKAQTADEMDQIRNYISGIIPLGNLRSIEKMNGDPEYATTINAAGVTTNRVFGLNAFIDYHQTRINESAARLNEKEGLNKL